MCNKHIGIWSGSEDSSHNNHCLCALFLGESMNWMNYAIIEAERAFNNNEVPVGCVLIKDNKIIAKGHNKRESKRDVLAHAEILCIKKASKRLKTWKLNGTILYVTLKPCRLCEIIIKESRVDKVYYLVDRLEEKKNYEKTIFVKMDNEEEEKYKELLNKFFQNKRKGEK